MIDACDRERFGESKVELDSLLTDEQLANCPVLVLGNKIDRPGAASEDELRQIFGLYGQTTGKGKVPRSELHGRPLELFMCSVLRRQGYGEGFRWISQYLDWFWWHLFLKMDRSPDEFVLLPNSNFFSGSTSVTTLYFFRNLWLAFFLYKLGSENIKEKSKRNTDKNIDTFILWYLSSTDNHEKSKEGRYVTVMVKVFNN